MQFNSLVFIIFATIFFGVWPILRRRNNLRWVYLVTASFVFYGWGDWRFLFLIMAGGFIDFFAYLALFPQLVAGPIVRARDLLPQLTTVKKLTEQQRWEGLNLIVFGYFKKVVVADTLAPTINAAFEAKIPTESWAFRSEQYLLQAFLCLNEAFEVVFGNYYMTSENMDKMRSFLSYPQRYRRHIHRSFWIRSIR